MKRTIKKDKRLLLSFEKVRDLTPLSNEQLKDVNGGLCTDNTSVTGVSTCPYSMNHNRQRLRW
jgi:hypothetical protein